MEISPLYFNYESPDVSKGKMYVHPLEDIKQSQIWKIESENMMNSLPSVMREYLTFDKFDEDTDKYNTIVNNFTDEINRITDDIQANGVTMDNQRAINDLATNINQQMTIGDLSLMRDNLASFRAWEAREMAAGKEDPVLYQRMRDAKKNEFLNNTSRDNLISIGTEQIIERPNFNDDNLKRTVMFELAKRISQKSAESPTETSWGTEEEIADILNGMFKNIDRGYVQQQAKYIYGFQNPVYEDPIVVYENEKGEKIAMVNPYHPYAKEAQELLTQMRATQKQYQHKVNVKDSKNWKTPGRNTQFNQYFSAPLTESDVEINTAYAFLPIATMAAPYPNASQSLDDIKLRRTRAAMIESATFDGLLSAGDRNKNISEAEEIMDMLVKIGRTKYFAKNPKGYENAVNDYFFGAPNIQLDKEDLLINYINSTRQDILRHEEDILNGKDNESVRGLDAGITVHKENGKVTSVTDDKTGITYKIEIGSTQTYNSDYIGERPIFSVEGVYIGETLYKFNELGKIYDKLNILKNSYKNYNERGIRTYKALTFDIAEDSDVNKSICNAFNNNKRHIVVVKSRIPDSDKIEKLKNDIDNTKDKKEKERLQAELNNVAKASAVKQDRYYNDKDSFKDDYEIVKVKQYIGSLDGIKSVFKCTVKTGEDETEDMLIGVTNKGGGAALQYKIKDDLIRTYINSADHKIPENLFYALTDTGFQDFEDYLTTYTVYDNSGKTTHIKTSAGLLKPEEGIDYVDIPIDGEMEQYLHVNFKNGEYKIRIYNPESGERTFSLVYKNSKTNEWEEIKDEKGNSKKTQAEIYDYVMTYGLDETLNSGKTLEYNGTTNSSLFHFFDNYFPTIRDGNHNYRFEAIMKGKCNKKYDDYPTYYSEIFDHVVLNALDKTCFNNSNPNDITFKPGCSFLLCGLFPDMANDKPTTKTLYELMGDSTYNDISKYISFGGEASINEFKSGGKFENAIMTGSILYLPQTQREGIIYAQYNGKEYVKYVLSAYNGKLEFIPLEVFLNSENTKNKNGKTKYCRLGHIKDEYYKKYMELNK